MVSAMEIAVIHGLLQAAPGYPSARCSSPRLSPHGILMVATSVSGPRPVRTGYGQRHRGRVEPLKVAGD